jgi:hypothetical protein
MEPRRHQEDKGGLISVFFDVTGIRGFAADSGRDVDPSNFELLSMSSSRLLPIFRIGAGGV